MNEILFFISIILCFSSVLLLKKLFGKTGLYVWMAIAPIIANIFTAKSIDLFGFSAVLGTVAFASSFLATDILNECYGYESSKKAVYISLVSVVIFLVASQFELLFEPNNLDFVSDSMDVVFSQSPRICIASTIMYFVANLVDVFLFQKLKNVFKGKHLWIRNNISTIVCNCLENALFVILAFAFVYPFSEILTIIATTCLIEIIVAVCDTPFIYIAKLTHKEGME